MARLLNQTAADISSSGYGLSLMTAPGAVPTGMKKIWDFDVATSFPASLAAMPGTKSAANAAAAKPQ
jgi:hypothetical protein